jgi:hypothetical protein
MACSVACRSWHARFPCHQGKGETRAAASRLLVAMPRPGYAERHQGHRPAAGRVHLRNHPRRRAGRGRPAPALPAADGGRGNGGQAHSGLCESARKPLVRTTGWMSRIAVKASAAHRWFVSASHRHQLRKIQLPNPVPARGSVSLLLQKIKAYASPVYRPFHRFVLMAAAFLPFPICLEDLIHSHGVAKVAGSSKQWASPLSQQTCRSVQDVAGNQAWRFHSYEKTTVRSSIFCDTRSR